MIHSILWAVVGTMHYVQKYTCHFHYIKIIMVPCVVSISNDNYYFLFIVLLCLMLYCCFLFDALTFIATQLYKMYAQCTYLCVDGSSCQLSICIWFSATNTFRRSVSRSREFQIRLFVIHSSPPVIKNRTLRNVLYESLQTWIIILNEHNFTKHEF